MADKYWWEEDDQNTKSQKDEEQGYWWEGNSVGSTVGNNILSRVNTWLENHNNYLTNYKNRFSGRKNSYEDSYVSDSGAWLDTITKQKSNFDAEYKNILAYMDQYSDYLDANWVKNVRHTLNSAWNQQNSIVRSSKKDNDYWLNFTPNEEQIAAGYDTAAKVYGNWQAERKQYDYDLNYDVDAAMLELEGLKKQKDAYLQDRRAAQSREGIGGWLGTTPDTSLPIAAGLQANSNTGIKERTKYDSRIAALQEQINRSKNVQAYKGYMDYMDANDFGEYSRAGAAIKNPTVTEAESGGRFLFWDWDGAEVGNIVTYSRDNADTLAMAGANNENVQGNYVYRNMTDDEVSVYNYLLAKYGKEKGEEFLSVIMDDLNAREGKAHAERLMGIDIPVIEEVAIGGYGLLAGLDQWGQGVRQYFSSEDLPTSSTQYANQYIAENLSGLGKYAYQATNVVGNMIPSIALSKGLGALGAGAGLAKAGGLATMGVSAAGNAYAEGLGYGMEPWEARIYGNLVGASEVALEYFIGKTPGLSRADDFVSKRIKEINKSWLRVGSKIGWDIVGEITEEELQNFLEPAFRGVFTGEYDAPTLDELLETAIVTAISTPAMGGVGTIVDDVRGSRAAMAKYGDKTDALIQEGLESDFNTDSYRLAQKYQQQVKGKDGEAGKPLTGNQIRNLLAANQEQITPKDLKLIQQAAEKRLTELGQTEDVSKLAELVTKYVTGQKMSKEEKNTLASSKYGSRAAQEALPKNIMAGTHTSGWAEEIGTKQVNKTAYNKKQIAEMVRSALEEMANPNAYKSLESRMEAEKKPEVYSKGKAVIRGTDEEIDLTAPKVKSISEKSVILDVNGKDVNIDDIDFADEDQWNMFNALKKIEHITPAVASSMIANLDMTKPVWGQLNGMDEAFTYGFHNYSEADLNAGNFTGNLTKDQLNDAYNLGKYVAKNNADSKRDDYKRMRTAADAIAEKNAAEGKTTEPKKLTITYNHGNGVVEDIDVALENLALEDEQAAGIELAKILHKMGIGTHFEFFTSYFSENLKDEDGNPLEVFTNDMGEEEAAYAGLYLASDGKIRINLKAYTGTRGLTLNAMSHELVHFIKDWSLDKYNILAEFLAEAYGESGLTMNQRVLREQARLKKIRGKEVGYDEAHEEVVANALNKMFEDGKALEKLAELKQKDRGLVKKMLQCIKDFLGKFMKVYRDNGSLYWDTHDLMEMKEAFEKARDLFVEALADASDNFQASLIVQEAAIESLGENAKVETNADGQLLIASNEKGNVQMYSEQTYKTGGREKLEMALRQNGHTEAEIKETLSYVDDALDYIKILAAGYAKESGYNALSDHLVADIVTNVKTGKQVMSAIVNNGDYPVNIDLALICKKRVAYMNLMTRLIQDGIFDKVNYDGAAIAEVNEILRDNGFETACLGCFVESRRLQFQTWAETIVSEWNAEVEKRNPNAKEFGFAQGKMENLTDADIDALTRELESVKKNDQGNVNLGQGNSVTRMGRLLDALPSLQKKLTVEDLLTPEGLTALRKHDGSLFSIVKSRYGAASPKIVQDFNPYASEIAMLTFANVKSITNNAVKGAQAYVNEVKGEYGKLKKNKGESKEDFKQRKAEHEQRIQDEAMRRYLYDIGGARIQSFSDFMIENIFDYIQIFADLAAKRLPLHGYTKEIVCVRLFGMTGAKWNGSLIAHVERSMGKELAGLLPAGTKDGIPVTVNGKEYVIGFDDFARNIATEGKSFIQSIGMKDIIALQLDPRYSPYVGNITIGVSDAQILAMLDNPLFRMVIPYHASGMLPLFAKLVGVDMYNDYTDYQNTTVRQYYDLNGNAVSELKNAKGEAIKADTSYAFNAEIQKTKDAKVAANNYLKWCAERHPVYDGSTLVGYATFNPKFSSSPYGTDFTRHENYYKLLEDFDTYDCITGESSVQGSVTMNFPSEANRLTEQQMADYKNALRETGIFTEKDIEKYAKKADMTLKEIIAAEVKNRASYAKTQAPKWESTVKDVEEKLMKDYARKSSQQTDADSQTKKILDNSSASNENKLTEKHDRGELSDNRRVREGATQTTEISGADRGGHSDHSGAAQETKNWKNLDPSDRKRIVGIVDSYIADSRNYEEFLDLLSHMVGRTADDISASLLKKAIRQISEKIFADATTMHPVIFEDRWSMFGDSASKLRKDILGATQVDSSRFSAQQTDKITNRDMLANAFETLSKSSEEYKMIQEYKGRIQLLNEQEEKLAKLNAKIREIRFTEGKYDAKKLRELEAKAKNIAKEINKQDKKLLSMEASEPLRKVIEQERKKEAEKTKAHVKEIQQNKKARAEQTELRHKIRKAVRDLDKLLNRGNKKLNVKEDMKDFVSKTLELADYLFTDHISNDELIRKGITVRMTPHEAALVKETEDILSKLYDNADNLTNEEFTRLDAKRKANEEKLRDLLTAQRNERLNTPVSKLFDDLVKSYASLKNSKQDAVKAAYDPNVERFLRSYIGETNGETDSDRKTLLQNMRVADMTTDELWKLHNAYKMVLHSVRDANKLWVKGKTETIEQMAGRIIGDFSKRKTPNGKVATVLRNLSNKMGWDYEKLHYALDRIGSEAFTELVMNIANSENTVMQDVIEAALFRDQMVEKYGFNNWAVNKEIDKEFLDNTGKKFKLTLGQMMALYAYSRREGAWDHIEYGGFVFGETALTNPRPADSYKLSKAQCEAITGLLTAEQKGYVEEMQKFLSETMGAKGNEVSMMLYGIKMFEEKNYFPIHIAGQFKAQAQESQAKNAAGFGSMSNAGFTHAQNPNAKAPFVLEGFNEIWVDHVNEMSRYHGTVPALEDMRRVMNRSSYSESGADSMAIKQLMENSYGKEAVAYFDNLYREANSGAITDKLQKKSKKLLSLFRKNSVAYSLSVIVQQPTAMIRAYAMIDKKYFGFKGFGTITSGIAKAVTSKWNPAYANAYNEMLKYAPGVTMAKEIGGFDTATGGSIRSYLLDTNKSTKQKWKTGTIAEKGKAVLDIVDDNAIANLPTVADKIAWIEIWNACKRETVAKHKDLAPNSEEFMQAVGKRFTEVIRATQVYDSIFAKSPMLKSKNLAVQYLVSFMNEPNTVANMVEKSVRDVSRGNVKAGVRTATYVVYSVIFNNLLKSMIYAMRDDDEDEAYTEKYIEAVVGNMMNDFNPLTYIPVARDVWSIAQGYDVERADMAIIADSLNALTSVIKNATTDTDDMTEEQLIEFDKKVTEANWKLVESFASFFGIPIKNVRREINGIIDHARIASANAGKTTAHSAWEKFRDAVIESIPFMSTNSKQDKLYDAIISGDTDYVNRLKAGYKDENAYHNAVRTALRENDPRIKEAAIAGFNGDPSERVRIARLIIKDGFAQDDVVAAINAEINKMKPDDESAGTKTKGIYTAEDFALEIANGDHASANAVKSDCIRTLQKNGKTTEDAEKSFRNSAKDELKDLYLDGKISADKVINALVTYCGFEREDAVGDIQYWDFKRDYPELFADDAWIDEYYEEVESSGIGLRTFVEYRNKVKGIEGADKKERRMDVIHSMPLTSEQKDALYLAEGWAESKLWQAPWH